MIASSIWLPPAKSVRHRNSSISLLKTPESAASPLDAPD
jgi:hypothetical protein